MEVKNGKGPLRKNINLLVTIKRGQTHITFWKISKIAATKCHIVRIKCTKFDFCWGSAQTPLVELTALPQTHQLQLRLYYENATHQLRTVMKTQK